MHDTGGFLASGFDALERNEALSLLVQRIERLPQLPKKVLAMYYYEKFPLDEMATAFSCSRLLRLIAAQKALGKLTPLRVLPDFRLRGRIMLFLTIVRMMVQVLK